MEEIKILKIEESPVSKDDIINIEILFNNFKYKGLLIKEKDVNINSNN